MKRQWQLLAAKLDTRNQRERALIFFMVLLVVAFLLNMLILSPLLVKKKKVQQEIAGQQAQLKTLQDQIQAITSVGKVDPDAPTRLQLAELDKKLQLSRAALDGLKQDLVPPEKMGSLLEDVLKQTHGLKLISLKTLPLSNVLDAPGKVLATTATPAKSAEATKPGVPVIYKHGFEIAVSGTYAELTQYLDALENLPWKMIWSKAEMQVEAYPRITLKITLYTLSRNETWLSL